MRNARTHRGRPGSAGTLVRGPTGLHAPVHLCLCVSGLLAACHGSEPPSTAVSKENDVPVAINSESPFQYPPTLYDQRIEGEVRLHLFVDAAGRVVPESTRVATSSGTPGLDSAAVRGAAQLHFAPAHRDGEPVAMTFYQPVVFRRAPEGPEGPPP